MGWIYCARTSPISKARHVWTPIIPSIVRSSPFGRRECTHVWKAITARRVLGPNTPSEHSPLVPGSARSQLFLGCPHRLASATPRHLHDQHRPSPIPHLPIRHQPVRPLESPYSSTGLRAKHTVWPDRQTMRHQKVLHGPHVQPGFGFFDQNPLTTVADRPGRAASSRCLRAQGCGSARRTGRAGRTAPSRG